MDDEPTPTADVINESRAVFALTSPKIRIKKKKKIFELIMEPNKICLKQKQKSKYIIVYMKENCASSIFFNLKSLYLACQIRQRIYLVDISKIGVHGH